MEKPKRVTLDDIRLVRDKDGNLEPIEAKSTLLRSTVLFRPITYGWVKKNNADTEVPATKWDLEMKLLCLREHYLEPSFDGITIQQLEEEFDPITVDHLLSLVVSYSTPMFRLSQKGMTIPGGVAEALLSALLLKSTRTSKDSSIKSDTDTQDEKTSIN